MKRIWLSLMLVLSALLFTACQSTSSGTAPHFTYATPQQRSNSGAGAEKENSNTQSGIQEAAGSAAERDGPSAARGPDTQEPGSEQPDSEEPSDGRVTAASESVPNVALSDSEAPDASPGEQDPAPQTRREKPPLPELPAPVKKQADSAKRGAPSNSAERGEADEVPAASKVPAAVSWPRREPLIRGSVDSGFRRPERLATPVPAEEVSQESARRGSRESRTGTAAAEPEERQSADAARSGNDSAGEQSRREAAGSGARGTQEARHEPEPRLSEPHPAVKAQQQMDSRRSAAAQQKESSSQAGARSRSGNGKASSSSGGSSDPSRNNRASAADPEQSVQTAVASRFEVRLSGRGWIYLGPESGAESVRFLGRETAEKETSFRFEIRKPGDYLLEFQKQNSDNGQVSRSSVAVEARDTADGSAASEPSASQAASEAGAANPQAEERSAELSAAAAGRRVGSAEQVAERQPRSDFDEAYALLEAGDKEAALSRFLSAFRGPNSPVAVDIAALAAELGRGDTAARFYRRAAENAERSSVSSQAEAGLFELAAAREDWESAAQYADAALEQNAVSSPEIYLELARIMGDTNPAGAIRLLERYLSNTESRDGEDFVHYRLGRLYERESELRHMGRAMENYRVVTESYPLSRYYEESAERMRYIQRHYVEIR